MTHKIKLELTPNEAAMVHKILVKVAYTGSIEDWQMARAIRTKIQVAEVDNFVATARARDQALPVEHTRGRSKLFKS